MAQTQYHFYCVIIGTEILNGRRVDKHFDFVKKALGVYNHTLFASFVIKDDTQLIEQTFRMIQNDPKAVMFSFGGIGSTPDDLTRAIASKVFRDSKPVVNQQFLQDIIDKFGDDAYPHRIHMAEIPPYATLLKNPINNMSGFALDSRYFFVPGFPSMAHPMIDNAIKTYFATPQIVYRKTLLADTSENQLISLMQTVPKTIELSSLPLFKDGKPHVELSLASSDQQELQHYFSLFEQQLQKSAIAYRLIENS